MIVEGDIHISSCYRVEDLLDCSRETEERFRGEVTDDIENIRFNNIKSKTQLEDVVFTNHVTIMLEKSMNLCGELNHDLMMIDGKMCTITKPTSKSLSDTSGSTTDNELMTDTVTFSNMTDDEEMTTLEILGYTVSLRRMPSITSLTSDNEIVFSCEMERKYKKENLYVGAIDVVLLQID
ncbi:unnamed protein product [Mytilus edulis]|uniref:Uncharacterized protein n=1 Tax=Mytilus edulis TaxID=6550 RepID=A0A8S3V910_MYTED|nr:unnamed protein product [Mytilus edulis]